MVVWKHLFTVWEGNLLFNRNVKPGMSGLGMVEKENFLAYSTQFVILTIRFVPGNVIMVAIYLCGESPITGEWIYWIMSKHVYFSISVLFIVYNTSILKLVFSFTYCFFLASHLSSCFVVVIVVFVAFFRLL